MNILKVSNLSFGYKYRESEFYDLSTDDKLNAIYDKLAHIQMAQDHNAEAISNNQFSQHASNRMAFNILFDTLPKNYYKTKSELVNDVFERNSVSILPCSGLEG